MASDLDDYKTCVDISKGYLDTALTVHIWFYAITGAIAVYYLNDKELYPYKVFSLILPILLGFGLIIASCKGRLQASALKAKTDEIGRELEIANFPPFDILRQSLLTFCILDVLIVLGLEFLFLSSFSFFSLSFNWSFIILLILNILVAVVLFLFFRDNEQLESKLRKYKAIYIELPGGTFQGEVLDFPGVIMCDKDLDKVRRLLRDELVDRVEKNLSVSKALPIPNSTLTVGKLHLEETICLILTTSTKAQVVAENVDE